MSFVCVGIDAFLMVKNLDLVPRQVGDLKLEFISQRGMMVWPGPKPDGIIVDWFRCRYQKANASEVTNSDIDRVLKELPAEVQWEKLQKLFQVNGKDMFSKAYGK